MENSSKTSRLNDVLWGPKCLSLYASIYWPCCKVLAGSAVLGDSYWAPSFQENPHGWKTTDGGWGYETLRSSCEALPHLQQGQYTEFIFESRNSLGSLWEQLIRA
eukprot:2231504-Amphidinium_carterae.1